MKNSNYFFNSFLISFGIILGIFMARQNTDIIFDIRTGMAIIIYPCLAAVCFYMVITRKDFVSLILFGLCSFFAYFLIKHYKMLFFSDFSFQEVVPFVFLILANLSFWYGLYLLRHEQTFLHIFGDAILTSVPIFLMLFLGNYLLPKPVQHLGVTEIMGFLIFCIGAIALAVGSHALFTNGSNGLSKWIPAGIARIMSFVSLIVCLVWINNVFYSGCYPLVAIGKECPCGIVQDSAVGGSISTLKDTVDDFSNQNPDIADVDDPYDPYDPVVTVIVPVELLRGGSLCGTLGMTESEALQFAIKNGMKYFYKKGKLIVLVYPGDRFEKIAGHWVKH